MAEKIAGYTSEMCQQAMIDELTELFRFRYFLFRVRRLYQLVLFCVL